MQSVHRAHFLDELVKGVPAQRAHFNKRLQDLEEKEDGVTLHFKDGTSTTADVAIGADGVHSKVRDFLVGAETGKPIFSGAVIYRGLVPMAPAIEVLGSKHAQNSIMLCGPGRTLSLVATLFGLTARKVRHFSATPSISGRLSTLPPLPSITKSGRMRIGLCPLFMKSLLLHSRAGANLHKIWSRYPHIALPNTLPSLLVSLAPRSSLELRLGPL